MNIQKDDCVFTPGLSTMAIIAPKTNAIITKANMADSATLKAFINDQLHHDDPLKRWHILGPYRGLNNNSTEVVEAEDEYGDADVSDDVRYRYSFRLKNGEASHKYLRTFNNLHERYVYFDIDSNRVLSGAYHEDLDANGDYQLTGYDLNKLFAPAPTKADRGNVRDYRIMIGLADTQQVVDEHYGVEMEFNPLRLRGVREVVIKDVTPSGTAAGTYHLELTTGDGKTNLASGTLGSALTDTTLIEGYNKATGAEIDVSTLTRNALNTAFIVTYDNAGDADWDANEQIEHRLAAVSVIEGLGGKWFANTNPAVSDMA